jgi:UTP--glucose-1-phosphate uridylyltransferase
MLPVVDKPLIQYAVEEAVEAGAERLVFVTHSSKGAIQAHFEHHDELVDALLYAGKQDILAAVEDILPTGVECHYVLQGDPLGLGHAVLCAREVVGDEPFFVHLPDDLIRVPGEGCLSQLRRHYESVGSSVVAVEEVPRERTASYGIVALGDGDAVAEIVEKPDPSVAPSTLAVVGRYLLTPGIFAELERTGEGSGGEIQLTDGIAALMGHEQVCAVRFDGQRYDCGSKIGYLKANVDYALQRDDLADALRAHLTGILAPTS